MSDDTITAQDIATRIEETAREILEDVDWDLDETHDRIHESVDGMDWVIYHYRAQQVIHACDANEVGEGFDRLGDMGYQFGCGDGKTDSWGQMCSLLAFCVLESMLSTKVQELHESYDPDDPEDDDPEPLTLDQYWVIPAPLTSGRNRRCATLMHARALALSLPAGTKVQIRSGWVSPVDGRFHVAGLTTHDPRAVSGGGFQAGQPAPKGVVQ